MRKRNILFSTRKSILVIVLLLSLCTSCKKYLDKKPQQSLVVPSNLSELQAVLDDNQLVNISPNYLELVADNYYVLATTLNSGIQEEYRLNYLWDRNARIVNVSSQEGWFSSYRTILKANLVLDLLPTISFEPSEQIAYNSLKGQALFHRAYQFYQLAQLFCRPYSSSAATDPGIVLKLTPLVTESYTRSTVQQTYDRIVADLKEAANLLPETALFPTRPSRAAAYGALSRTYLSMRDYDNARIYADTALSLKSTLLDYKSLIPANTLPVNYLANPEVLFESVGANDLLTYPRAIVDSNLYQSYSSSDLRKQVFFGDFGGGKHYFKGSYFSTGNFYDPFTGVVTDEIYLIRAECFARAGNKNGAMADLNFLLRNRYDNTFTDLTATDATDALTKILVERRKELIFRGVRWTDLRRFNMENANITLTRIINGITYTLPPNDLRWVLLIPEDEINRSGIPQNPR